MQRRYVSASLVVAAMLQLMEGAACDGTSCLLPERASFCAFRGSLLCFSQVDKQEAGPVMGHWPVRASLCSGFSASLPFLSSQEQPRGHALWTKLLKTYVNKDGLVDYARWQKAPEQLGSYLDWLRTHVPSRSSPQSEQIAYWINLYNAFTIDLILRHYPVLSIRDISSQGAESPWKIAFIELPRGAVSLDYVENELLRKRFSEPRIHFALVCAAMSCPPLRQEAYLPSQLSQQLDEQGRRFLQDSTKNRTQGQEAQISPLFKWFTSDFTKKGTLVGYLNKYLSAPLPAEAKISYMSYDWGLNVQK